MRILSRYDLEAISRKVLLQYLKLCKETPTWIDPVDFGRRILHDYENYEQDYCDATIKELDARIAALLCGRFYD